MRARASSVGFVGRASATRIILAAWPWSEPGAGCDRRLAGLPNSRRSRGAGERSRGSTSVSALDSRPRLACVVENAGKENGRAPRSGGYSAEIRAGDRSGVLYPVRLGAGANSFGHARGRKNKAFTAFSASPRHDFSSAFPTEPAMVGRVSDGQIRALNRSRLDSVPNTVGAARGVHFLRRSARRSTIMAKSSDRIRDRHRLIHTGLWS